MQYNAVLTDSNLIESPLSSEEVMFLWSAISGIYSGTSLIWTSITQALCYLGTSIFQIAQSGRVACTIIKLGVDERSPKVLVYLLGGLFMSNLLSCTWLLTFTAQWRALECTSYFAH